jgi:hypothetical protein
MTRLRLCCYLLGGAQAQNIRRALDGELDFYSRVFRIAADLPADYTPVAVVNLQ